MEITYPLLLGILLGSSLPLLLLVQFLLDSTRPPVLSLESRLVIRVDGQDPLLFTEALQILDDRGDAALEGTGTLHQGSFPWDPTPFEARFRLRLTDDLLAAPGEHTSGWAASYRERLTTRADGYGSPPIPCEGRVAVRELRTSAPHPRTFEDLEELELALDLQCMSAGPDLLWMTGDEQVWTIEGPISLKRSRG